MSEFYKNIDLNGNRIINVNDPIDLTDAVNLKYLQDSIGASYDSNITVIATGTDTYIGVGTPTILSYSITSVYIVTFDNNNTISNPTLDIDGIGSITIVKTDNTGIIPLAIGDIVAGIQYFLTFNGSEFQMYLSNPSGTTGTYTNLNAVPTTIGGISAGTTFNSTPITTVFDMLLYPYQNADFTSYVMSAQTTPLEVGATVSNISRTFTWSTSNSAFVTPNSINIYSLTGGTTLILGSASNSGSAVLTLAAPISYNTPSSFYEWQITGKRTNNVNFSRLYRVTWLSKMFYGTSISPLLTDVQALSMTGFLANSILGTFVFAAGGYKYFIIPNNLTNPTSFKDQATNLTVGMADAVDGYSDTNAGTYTFKNLPITNSFGVTQTYRVYRTKYMLGGSINIIVA